MESKEPEVEVIDNPRVGRRRRFTAEEKRAFVEEAARPGNSISQVARRYNLSPSLLFSWRRLMEEGSMSSLGAEEPVVPESEVKQLKSRVRELERLLGKKTLENEILKDAIEIAREKKLISRSPLLGRKGTR
jgi:transposase